MRHHLKVVGTLVAVLLSLGALIAQAQGAPAYQSKAKKKKTSSHQFKRAKALPCENDFELSVLVQPAGGIDAEPLGLKVRYKNGRGLASRTEREQSTRLDRKACLNWQKKYWHWLTRAMLENLRPERSNLICHNVASVKYRIGSQKRSADICLASAKTDNVTYGFRKFLEGTDLLIVR